MTIGPPFERYPGPPTNRSDVFRVISPHRDALAWISIASKLTLVRFLVRESEGWRTVVDLSPDDQQNGSGIWEFAYRDPIELVFTTSSLIRIEATAFVTVTKERCEVRVETQTPHLYPDCLFAEETDSFRIRPR